MTIDPSTPRHEPRPEPVFRAFPGLYSAEHPSGEIPVDWCEIVVPAEHWQGPPAGERLCVGIDGRLFPATVSHRKGLQGVAIRALIPFPRGGDTGYAVGSSAGAPTLPPFTQHASILPLPGVASSEVVRQNDAELVERCVMPRGVLVWRTTRSMSPVVDAVIRFTTRGGEEDWFSEQVDFGPGAVVHLMPGSKWSEVSVEGSMVVWQGGLDYGTAPTVRVRVTYPEAENEGAIDELLRATASKPKAVGVCNHYRQRGITGEPLRLGGDREASVQTIKNRAAAARWLTLGVVPRSSEAGLRRFLASPAPTLPGSLPSIYDVRPLAQGLSTNAAGTQRYGSSFSGALHWASPADAYRVLELSAGDEELRPIHLYEADGSILRAKDHPDCRMHNRRIHWRNAKDKLGLTEAPPRVTTYSRRTADDLQHTDDLAIDAFLALFDDPALEETRRHMIELDALDDAVLNGRINSAARGWGRPAVSIANAAWLFDGDESGTLAQATGIATLHAALASWEGRSIPADRPIKPMKTLKGVSSWALEDPRTGEPMRVAACYEHATAVVGAIALAQILPQSNAREALGLAMMLSVTCLNWLVADHIRGGYQWPFIIGVFEGDEDGDALPADWLRTDSPHIRKVAQLGGSWTRWTGPVAYALPYLQEALGIDVAPELQERAAVVREALDVSDATLNDAQDDELYRMTAMPMSLAEAPLVGG